MRVLASLAVITILAFPSAAGAEAEWTDGTPPPKDFGLQETAPPSVTSAYAWLRSAIDGEAVEATWNESGVDISLLEPLRGGVADGMRTAIDARARSGR